MKLKKILQISIWRTNKVPHFSLFIRNNSGTVRRCSRRLVNNCTLTARDIAFSSHPLTWKTRADLTNYSVDGSQRIKIFRQRWLHTQHNGNWGVPVDVALDTSIWGDYELKTFAFGHKNSESECRITQIRYFYFHNIWSRYCSRGGGNGNHIHWIHKAYYESFLVNIRRKMVFFMIE